jgi:hypothetical protein
MRSFERTRLVTFGLPRVQLVAKSRYKVVRVYPEMACQSHAL